MVREHYLYSFYILEFIWALFMIIYVYNFDSMFYKTWKYISIKIFFIKYPLVILINYALLIPYLFFLLLCSCFPRD